MIAVVDAGTGNLRSVEKALVAAGGRDVRVTGDAAVVRAAERVVVPGQGAFGDCGRALARDAPLGRALLDVIAAGTPYLGICLGLQILFESSEEAPGCDGLGVLRGRVERLRGEGLKVPHMGWNDVRPRRAHPLLRATLAALHNDSPGPARADGPARAEDADDAVPYYFVHGYHAVPAEPFTVVATADYGPHALAAAVACDNVFAVQFHPEKSQRAGLALLAAFLAWRC